MQLQSTRDTTIISMTRDVQCWPL